MKTPRAIKELMENPPDKTCAAHPLLTEYVVELQRTLREEITEIDEKIDEIRSYITRQKTLEENREKHTQLVNNIFITLLSTTIGFITALILKGI